MQLDERAWAAFDRLHPGGALGVAVSGGGDSVALLQLAAVWGRARGVRVAVATVDHGLRRESAEEAAFVAGLASALGLSCAVLRWHDGAGHGNPHGNLQARARAARSALLGGWAAGGGLACVATGHTRDDQAETVLMRLARGSGVDGLAGIPERAYRAGTLWLRPLLGIGRAELRGWLAGHGVAWREDPSNLDPRFERVRARQVLAALAPLGIDPAGLAATAAHMARARVALERAADAGAGAVGHCGEVDLRVASIVESPDEIALRVLARALMATSGNPYPPRFVRLARLLEAVRAGTLGGGRTLHGCVIAPQPGGAALMIAREPEAARQVTAPISGVWDRRWAVRVEQGGEVRAVGEAGLARLRAAARDGVWRAPRAWTLAPRAARLTTPGLWCGDVLACAPLAAYGVGLTARCLAGAR